MSDKNHKSIEKESLTYSQTDNTKTTVSEVQTNILEPEKINVPSSKIDSANLSAEKAKDSQETSLNPPKVTSPSSDTSFAKTNDNNQESIKKESLTKSETETTETTVSNVQTNILESEKINVLSSKIDSALLSAEKANDSDGTSLNLSKQTSLSSDTYLAKTNHNNQESIENESLTKS